MKRRKSSLPRWVFGILAALGTVAILMGLSKCNTGNKDDKPSGPVASLAPSAGPLNAESVTTDTHRERLCNNLLRASSVEYNTQYKPLSIDVTAGNSTSTSIGEYDLFCTYSSPTRWAVGRASYQKLTPKGVKNYNGTRTGHDDMLIAKPIPAGEMPHGVTSAFYFTPAAMPNDMSSWYRAPGVQMLVGNELVVISFKDFDILPTGVRQAFMKNALKDVIK